MSVEKFRSKRDRELDALALRLADVLDGESPTDCMLTCASVIGFVLRGQRPETRERNQEAISKFIREIAERKREL